MTRRAPPRDSYRLAECVRRFDARLREAERRLTFLRRVAALGTRPRWPKACSCPLRPENVWALSAWAGAAASTPAANAMAASRGNLVMTKSSNRARGRPTR